ncbi:glycosyltransferase [Paraflavitalea pollutisoli]|uniref:glycosyltransferase n=1 Tax=Paraflavitalea pollutisoli TaxID=3034143 RepID=UPI0023ED9381|nr:glycosyltransferase [Paraflavitalea sp. H1-2-19X]
MRPLVSICMSTYRHERFIKQAIEGVMMQQTDFDIELVIGEDFSNDGTRSICENLAAHYGSKIKLLPSDRNYGQNQNLSRIILACSGKYIAMCEGDDYWIDPDKLFKQVDYLEKHPAHVMCFHLINTVDQEGGLLETQEGDGSVTEYRGMDLFHTFVPTLSILFRNCLDYFPPEFYKIKSTDAFIVGMLSGHGDGARLGFVGGCYRKHDGGLFNQLPMLDKYKQAIHTRKWMRRSDYFKKEQKKEIRRELFRREVLYMKIFLRKRQLWSCFRLVIFYISI